MKNKVEAVEQCFGEWRMLDDLSNAKRIILKPDGQAEFIAIKIGDFGRDEAGELPAFGTWKLSPGGDQIEFWFALNGGDYGESGVLKEKKGGLELWFSVGDPDDFAWKRFRHVTPKAD